VCSTWKHKTLAYHVVAWKLRYQCDISVVNDSLVGYKYISAFCATKVTTGRQKIIGQFCFVCCNAFIAPYIRSKNRSSIHSVLPGGSNTVGPEGSTRHTRVISILCRGLQC